MKQATSWRMQFKALVGPALVAIGALGLGYCVGVAVANSRLQWQQRERVEALRVEFGDDVIPHMVDKNPIPFLSKLGLADHGQGSYSWSVESYIIIGGPIYQVDVLVEVVEGGWTVKWYDAGGYAWGYFL